MKIIRISGLCLLLSLVAISLWSAHSINSRKNLEPPLIYAGKIPDLETPVRLLLKHQVCPNFPIKLYSETIEEVYADVQSMCIVTYKGHRLILSDSNKVMKMLNVGF